MAKKTLQSLLGTSDRREEVDLNLDDTQFRAPRVQAGQYSVRVQETAKTNLASQLSNSLGRYAGPIARQYQTIETQRQEEYAQIAELFTPEQAAAIQRGDTSEVQESLDKLYNALDSQQRKKAIKFVENPANYIRASRVLGSKIESQYSLDIQQNEDQYVNSEEDIPALLKKTRDDVIANNNLTGYALEGFLESANRHDAKKLPILQKKRDDLTEANYITNSVDSVVGNIIVDSEFGDYSAVGQEFTERFNGYTPAEQTSYLESVVNRLLTKEEYTAAEEFVSWLATDPEGLKLGQDALLPEGAFNQLNEMITKARLDEETLDNKVQASLMAKNNEALASTIADLQQGNPVASMTLSFGKESTIEVDLQGAETELDVLERTRSAIYSAELEPETKKGGLYAQLTKQIEAIQTDNVNRYNRLGVTQLMGEFQSSLTLEVAGENVLGMTDEQALETRFEAEQRLRDGIDEIQADDEKYPTIEAKTNAQRRLIEQTRLELNKDAEERFQTYNDTTRVIKVQDRVGLGVNGAFEAELNRKLVAAESQFGLQPEASVLRQIKDTVKSERDRLREEAREIITAPYSDEERKDLRLAFENRQRQIQDLLDEAMDSAVLATMEEPEITPQAQQAEAGVRPRDLSKVDSRLRYTPNFDGAIDDEPNGYTQDGIMFHPDGQNYRGKFPTGDLYNKGSRKHQQAKEKAKDLNKLRTKVMEQAEGRRNIVAEDRFASKPLISFTAGKYFDALYGARTAINGEPAVTVDEIRAGRLEGQVPFDPSLIDLTSFPVLSPDMINNPDDYEEQILDYASALNIPRDKIPAFLYGQAQALSARGIIFITTINTQNEE